MRPESGKIVQIIKNRLLGPKVEIPEPEQRIKFSDSEKEALKRKGLVIYRLTGKSIQFFLDNKVFPDLGQVARDEAEKNGVTVTIENPQDFLEFWMGNAETNPAIVEALKRGFGMGSVVVSSGDKYHEKDYPKMLALPSRKTDVAVNPDNPLLPGSNKKTLEQQLKMMEEYSQSLRAEPDLRNVHAILGEAPDYVEIIMRHFLEYGSSLYREEMGFDIRTKTSTFSKGYHTATVSMQYDSSILIEHTYNWDDSPFIWASPIIIPSRMPLVN